MRNFELIGNFLLQLLPVINITLTVSVSALVLGSFIGLILTLGKIGSSRILRGIAAGYISIVRATPPIIMIFLVYYGLPFITANFFKINIEGWNRIYFVTIALTLLFSAPVAEIMRSAYLSIDKGQYEAGIMVGMNKFQIFYRIILPQATVVALPNYATALINLLKEGSLTFTIGVVDMVAKSQMIVSNNSGGYAWQTYGSLALIYWALSLAIGRVVALSEKAYQKKRQSISI